MDDAVISRLYGLKDREDIRYIYSASKIVTASSDSRTIAYPQRQ